MDYLGVLDVITTVLKRGDGVREAFAPPPIAPRHCPTPTALHPSDLRRGWGVSPHQAILRSNTWGLQFNSILTQLELAQAAQVKGSVPQGGPTEDTNGRSMSSAYPQLLADVATDQTSS